MRRMSRHFVIQQLQDYLPLHTAVQNYYMRKPHTFRIPSYATDENVREVVDPLLVKYGGQARSNYRKAVWKLTKQGASLDVWAAFIMKHYHFHRTGTAPVMVKARIALARQVALPLVLLPTAKGQNTMFWTKMRSALAALYAKHGPNLETTEWKQWAAHIIAADEAAYTAQTVDLPDEGPGGTGSDAVDADPIEGSGPVDGASDGGAGSSTEGAADAASSANRSSASAPTGSAGSASPPASASVSRVDALDPDDTLASA
ncbi:hypothetical protein AURDEDRAFT_122206 [Auricularia subglabra TFB-10046 SS5]|nr:hypothetical protein AURDEDRAFT_122206 [Auricularia subglabra TFB-10046 SS5]